MTSTRISIKGVRDRLLHTPQGDTFESILFQRGSLWRGTLQKDGVVRIRFGGNMYDVPRNLWRKVDPISAQPLKAKKVKKDFKYGDRVLVRYCGKQVRGYYYSEYATGPKKRGRHICVSHDLRGPAGGCGIGHLVKNVTFVRHATKAELNKLLAWKGGVC